MAEVMTTAAKEEVRQHRMKREGGGSVGQLGETSTIVGYFHVQT